jgi:SEC-C motif
MSDDFPVRIFGQKIGRNDPCWCGSGVKFKQCHLGRSDERPLPLPAVANQLRKFFKAKKCLHPLASAGARSPREMRSRSRP